MDLNAIVTPSKGKIKRTREKTHSSPFTFGVQYYQGCAQDTHPSLSTYWKIRFTEPHEKETWNSETMLTLVDWPKIPPKYY